MCLPRDCLPRGCLPRGSAQGVCIPACNGADTSSSCEQNDRQIGVKTLPCPKLCLWVVKIVKFWSGDALK